MNFVGILISSVILIGLTGCYTVVYHSADTEILYSEPIYIPVPLPDPCPMPLPGPMPIPPSRPIYEQPVEKIRHDDINRNKIDDSYKERDPIRNQGGRGNGDRNTQGR